MDEQSRRQVRTSGCRPIPAAGYPATDGADLTDSRRIGAISPEFAVQSARTRKTCGFWTLPVTDGVGGSPERDLRDWNSSHGIRGWPRSRDASQCECYTAELSGIL